MMMMMMMKLQRMLIVTETTMLMMLMMRNVEIGSRSRIRGRRTTFKCRRGATGRWRQGTCWARQRMSWGLCWRRT
eukprot:755482-Hanusia_phi.AAC.2